MWRSTLGHPWPGVLSLLSPRVAVLVHSQLATLCKLRQSYQCAGNARAHQTSVPDLSKSAVFFGDPASTFEIYKQNTHFSWLRAERVSLTGIEFQLWGKENSQIIAVIGHKLKEWFSRITTADRKWSCGHPGMWITRRKIEFWLSLVSQSFLKLQIITVSLAHFCAGFSKIRGKVFCVPHSIFDCQNVKSVEMTMRWTRWECSSFSLCLGNIILYAYTISASTLWGSIEVRKKVI